MPSDASPQTSKSCRDSRDVRNQATNECVVVHNQNTLMHRVASLEETSGVGVVTSVRHRTPASSRRQYRLLIGTTVLRHTCQKEVVSRMPWTYSHIDALSCLLSVAREVAYRESTWNGVVVVLKCGSVTEREGRTTGFRPSGHGETNFQLATINVSERLKGKQSSKSCREYDRHKDSRSMAMNDQVTATYDPSH